MLETNIRGSKMACPRCGGRHHYPAKVYSVGGPLMSRCIGCGFSVRASEYAPQVTTTRVVLGENGRLVREIYQPTGGRGYQG